MKCKRLIYFRSRNEIWKKVIVGSITSFIITAVGIAAVFFHDLLNLQNEKILSLKVDLDTQKDIEKFENFLNTRMKDEKIFKLDVCLPDFLWVDNKWLSTNWRKICFNKKLLKSINFKIYAFYGVIPQFQLLYRRKVEHRAKLLFLQFPVRLKVNEARRARLKIFFDL